MGTVTAQADIAQDWKGLLDSTEKSPEVLPSVETECQALSQLLNKFLVLKAQQDELTAKRQETTQQLNETIDQGKDVAVQIRSVLRGKVGPRNERLVQYKIAPLRRRPRKPVLEIKKLASEVRPEPVVEVPSPAKPVA